MNTLPKFLLYAFGIFFFLSALVFLLFPAITETVFFSQRARVAKLQKKTQKIGDYTINLYQSTGAKKDTLVLLHGLADRKSGFLKTAKYFAQDYYLIIPDLPGHGENLKVPDLDYSIPSQANYISNLLEVLSIKRFHIAGVATGGLIALAITNNDPDKIKSITLINTPSVKLLPDAYYSIFSEELHNNDDLHKILNYVFYQNPSFSYVTEKHLLLNINPDLKFVNQFIIPSLKKLNYRIFENSLSSIQVPGLVVHSTKDPLITIEHAAYYNKALPNSIYGTIKNTAHYPQYENPSRFASSIIGQIKRTSKTKLP